MDSQISGVHIMVFDYFLYTSKSVGVYVKNGNL